MMGVCALQEQGSSLPLFPKPLLDVVIRNGNFFDTESNKGTFRFLVHIFLSLPI